MVEVTEVVVVVVVPEVIKKAFHLDNRFLGGTTGREQALRMHSWLPSYFQLTAVQPLVITQDAWQNV